MNIQKVKKRFAAILSALILVLLVISMILMVSVIKSISYQQMQSAVDGMVRQTSDSFEFAIGQIQEQVSKLSVYDNEIAALAQERYHNSVSAREVYSRLRNIKTGSSYISAVYLYSQQENRFLDSDKGCSYLAEDFIDPMIYEAVSSQYMTSVAPHLVRSSSDAEVGLYYTLIVPLLHYANKTGFVLCIQIDMDKLYTDILKEKINDGAALYICQNDKSILTAQDRSVIGENAEHLKKEISDQTLFDLLLSGSGVMDAEIWSQELGWYFYLQIPYAITIPEAFNTYVVLWITLLIVLIIVIMVYLMLNAMMRPFQDIVHELNKKHLKELLTDSFLETKASDDYANLKKSFPFSNLQVIVIDSLHNLSDFSQSVLSVVKKMNEEGNITIFPISMTGSRAALVCSYELKAWNEDKKSAWLRRLLQETDQLYQNEAYIAVSLLKTDVSQLPLAYKECEEIEGCKLYMKKRILRYEELTEKQISFSYPVELERQLINNLLLGNPTGSALYMEKFMEYVLDNESIFPDNQIIYAIYQMQNEILKRVSSLPISINTSALTAIPKSASREELRALMMEFIQYLSDKILKKNEKNESLLNQSILEYIDSHLMDEDFNLNTVSYQLNLNRNYLARLIKEKTGKTFNEYVNFKKIAAAKELLRSTRLSVEEIAHQTGFSYSHYFIKIFKAQEGVTPGQYRETMLNNNYAQQ